MNYEITKKKIHLIGSKGISTTEILVAISKIVNRGIPEWEGRDLVIRALDKIDFFDTVEKSLLLSMVRSVGLYPYIKPYLDEVSDDDRLAYEIHRIDNVEPGMVFHRLQAHVYNLLMQRKNVVLSASTSVGKSLVIDAILASKQYSKIVVVVPTIALIDETRRRMVKRFRSHCNIITHPSQEATLSLANVYLLTQERVLQRGDLDDVDFFVIDEFYKLDLENDSDEKNRSIDLSLAFHRLAKQGAQFYLLGPNIQDIQGLEAYEYNFIPSSFSTVSVDVYHYNLSSKGDARKEKLLELCSQLSSPTLIYCQSPASANKVAQFLINEANLPCVENTQDVADWIGKHYHPDWNISKAISLGVGIHHGGVPRALQQYFVKLFNEGAIRFIVCTSTMIEGVNTSAENVIIYDRRVNNTPFDFFTFKNISGRAGRMNRYFIGKVYMLEAPPLEKDLSVEYPVGSQNEDSPMGLLLKLEPEFLSDLSRQRLEQAYSTPQISAVTLIENRHVPIEVQVKIAEQILEDQHEHKHLLCWKGNPEQNQLEYLCSLVYEHLPHNLMEYGIFSGLQLAWHINALRSQKNFTEYLQQAIDDDWHNRTPSEAIGLRLKLIRNVISYRLPRDFMSISRIQADVLGRRNLEFGDYTFISEQLENLFQDPLITALDEYGIPIQISTKIKGMILPSDNLNEVLAKLRKLVVKIDEMQLSKFEKNILRWAIAEM
ncbi:DEAD/DEAH box helicase [Cronobacter turicensis]|uniref:DEAD/DEAH box helicase n=1 Tax=Cronobacter turicensis TaxID=413502 RepID=UPI0024C34C0B|nr:DEAD/DEAH box helicase [Cronobacter turicensis]MDK1237466.1 DEAD/DEAH box helicase [Cronobacter turicensis]